MKHFEKKIIFSILWLLVMLISRAIASVEISSVTVSAIKTNSAVISWDSTAVGTSQIEYGLTSSYGMMTAEESLSYFHMTELGGLAEGTVYHFRIRSKEYGGAETVSADYTFTTRTQAEVEAVIRLGRADGGLPKVYYVKTDGNDANDGFSIATAWQKPSYAVSKADAGDTIYLIDDPTNPSDGTWYNDRVVFSRSGIDVAPITLAAYNGTPMLDGIDKSSGGISFVGRSYINISKLIIRNTNRGISVSGSNNIHISDSEIYNVSGSAVYFYESNYSSLENSDIHDTGWNSVAIQVNNGDSHHISIINNKIHDNPGTSGGEGHNLIDLFQYGMNVRISDITIANNSLYNLPQSALFEHAQDTYQQMKRVCFTNNTIWDGGIGVRLDLLTDSIVSNNNILNGSGYGFTSTEHNSNITLSGNKVRNTSGESITLAGTYTNITVSLVQNDVPLYRINRGNATVQDALGTNFNVQSRYATTIETLFTNGLVISKAIASQSAPGWTMSETVYYPTKSNFSITGPPGNEWLEVTVTKYPMTTRPASESATVTVNKFDTTLTKGNILVDFTADTANGNNVDFVVGGLKTDTNYQITRAGANYHVVKSNANKCIAFSNSEWSAKTFIVSETGAAADLITPPEINISSGTIPPPLPMVPSSPQNLAAIADNSQVALSWQLPASDGGSAITNYKIYRGLSSGSEAFLLQVGTNLSYIDTNINNGLTYYYQVSAVNSVGEGTKSNEVTATPTVSTEISSKIKVYPNPYVKGKSGSEKITFANLSKEAALKIYNTNGELVKELSSGADGKAEWDIKEISSGIYLYVISSTEGTRKGKISIVK